MATTISFLSPPAKLSGHCPHSLSSRFPSKRLSLRTTCNASADESAAAAAPAPAPESPVETTKSLPSLISAANVQKALRGIAITNADHYGRLGIPRGSSYDRVNIAYKEKCQELMNQGLKEEEANKELELLKESHVILSSEEERRLYDWSLARSDQPDRYIWPFEVDITQAPTGTPPPQEAEDEGPTRLVGYFFLTWIVLSFVLSIALNR